MRKSWQHSVKRKHARKSERYVGKSLVLGADRVLVIGRLHFLVRAKSLDGWYCVDLETVNDEWPEGGCSCQGFQARRTCRHVDAIKRWLGI